ncbi:MAG: non-canonical purine NTP pyrophosphatase [Flavobacteriaceae bacterium]|nr:non-canonical purine NTP pyrophosphatase [Flavobacteriaceae bacterium]|tara:strand:+ start:95090 stop:95671 length:582 start_codon:yes stop_codon:yes gene_type:complete
MKLVFSTNNQNKLLEVQKMLPPEIELLSLKDIHCFDDVEETEDTLEGNAKLKANHIRDNYHVNCFSDDTGLEVEALNGRPGVYSARYAGEPANAENNIEKLLGELQGKTNRKAQFRTAICLNLNDEEFFFEGVCKGMIIDEKRGTKGFGYDPVFIPDGFDQTFAEMNEADKNRISHRGLAIQQLTDFLKSKFA